ncbi:MAG: putative ABC transporter periplasmic-binding protein [Methanosaeta sp. PtaU1.Bin060]|nr:MAG: putative ABC transporter periplasmic-binding protein [Methanosaeta sp. PtaU1.Bin060]
MKRLDILAVCLILSGIFLGCTGSLAAPTESEMARDQELTATYPTDIMANKLDASSYKGAITVYPMIYDALVNYGEGGKIEPGLAKSWEVEDDGGKMVITFHLRDGVKFSDGTPFNADAVKFSLERAKILNPKDTTPVLQKLDEIEIVDDYTVKLIYDSYLYPILKQLTFPRPIRIMSPTAVSPEGDPNGAFVKPIGTGMWVIGDYVQDQYAVLTRNPYYWGEKPILEKITFKVIPDAQTRALALQSGDVELIGGKIGRILPETVPVLESDKNIVVERELGTESYYLVFKYNKYPFNDTLVRKAVNFAIDKDNMVSVVGIGEPAKGFFAPTVNYVTDENSYNYPYDVDEAKRLLAEAGWMDTDGDGILEKDGKKFEVDLIYQVVDYPEWGRMCELIQEDLRKVGIKVNLLNLESAAFYERLWTTRDFDLMIYMTYSSEWSPEGMLTLQFTYPSPTLHATSRDDEAVTFGNPKLNELINEVMTTRVEDKRQSLYDQIFKEIYDEAACVPLYYCEKVFAMNSHVKGFEFGASEYDPVKWGRLWVSS